MASSRQRTPLLPFTHLCSFAAALLLHCRSAVLSTTSMRSHRCSSPKPPATTLLMRLLPPSARPPSSHSSNCHRREGHRPLPSTSSTAGVNLSRPSSGQTIDAALLTPALSSSPTQPTPPATPSLAPHHHPPPAKLCHCGNTPSSELPFRPIAKLSSIRHQRALVSLPTPPDRRLTEILAGTTAMRHDPSALPCFISRPKAELSWVWPMWPEGNGIPYLFPLILVQIKFKFQQPGILLNLV
jgi:hypothetical protein